MLFLVFLLSIFTACKKEANLSTSPRIYTMKASEQAIIKPSVVLEENNKFTFTFSAVSSYIGRGSYELSDNHLYLRTEDGNYQYVFNVADNHFVFDAEHSSPFLWYSDIVDGAVFE